MIQNNRTFKNGIKHKIGIALSETRHNLGLKLNDVARTTGVSWQDIDNAEIGRTCGWPIYRRLLAFYNKDVTVVLTDTENAG